MLEKSQGRSDLTAKSDIKIKKEKKPQVFKRAKEHFDINN